MRIIIAGATGFIGRSLVPALLQQGAQVTVLGRSRAKCQSLFAALPVLTWEQLQTLDANAFDVVINLCGENIGEKRWSQQRKDMMVASRVETTRVLAQWISKAQQPSAIRLMNASAIGIYGLVDQLSEQRCDESTVVDVDAAVFSQQVVQQWEAAVTDYLAADVPRVILRFAVVLQRGEGMLKKLERPCKLGLAGVVGSGKQPLSWVYIDDLVAAIIFLITRPDIEGPVNIVAPEVVSQRCFIKTLAGCLKRPSFLPMPAVLVNLLFGQMGRELLLLGQAVSAARLQAAGFSFAYGELAQALRKVTDAA